jgi:hypothetical protein
LSRDGARRNLFSVDDSDGRFRNIVDGADLLGIALADNEAFFPMGESDNDKVHVAHDLLQAGKLPAARSLFGQVNTRDVNFAALERVKGEAAAHQAGDQVFHVLGGKKHRRVAAADYDLAAHIFAVFEELDPDPFFVRFGPDDQSAGGSAQAGQFADAHERPHQYPVADLRHLRAHRRAPSGTAPRSSPSRSRPGS